ncbi:hypothetical protein TanjilG_03572 [Lupinus angustifolius]|uniref:Uncharacterized protein n=1 Tax=Lupinus angustifolius TaxID=3871 RepID=A0A1J7HZ97_LUPAN|nr:PREDICTED: uncharacterized protein LOC109352336 [Lupinus angustifolius]XP_019449820.1 PREDICTED: uncharacterized protein LOC109352336 [Lupinus angustifolius]XP_019449821.1 PREDICTED: uncharacterized protein LOC109352336 [Lupinus angustifolius]XP_019449822.1 PREDICTED: uncharacterized protein LOC109352336 [Lupinus angustifolius]OIW07785.1 hypothetical protein TanjilG_03572 [Lupinus angustifolius]
MHGFSTVDGFVEISDCLAEMIKYVANEPSVGLFYIQQHTQNAVPNVVKLKNSVVDKSHETSLHMEDLEDSVTMVKSMKECGFPIADEMIGDIKKSLVTMTTKQPKRGLINRSSSNFQRPKASLWGNTSVYAQEVSEKRGNYFSSVFKFSKQNDGNLKSPQVDSTGSVDSMTEKPPLYNNLPSSAASASIPSLHSVETNELPPSSEVEDLSQSEQSDISNLGNKLLSLSEKYEDFKANKEAKLEEWLGGTSNDVDNSQGR